jgi:hypothetical protein
VRVLGERRGENNAKVGKGSMKPANALKVATAAVVTVIVSASALSTASTATPAPAIKRNVIVILRDQMPTLPAVRGQRAARAAALASAQAPIVSHLQASGAARIRGFAMINAVTANVTATEEQALAAHPLVQAVVPERVISLHPANARSAFSGANSGAVAGGGAGAPICNTLEPEALQLTNTAFLDPSIPQAQRVRDGNGEFITGKGVKVAWIADGLDPTIQGFHHTDGTPVFIDYQDFSGDPAGTPSGGEEAFGDASSIAANDTPNGVTLSFDISQYVDTALGTLPPGKCNIRVRGMAPGASLVGLKAFSAIGVTTNTAIAQAIEYAVVNDDVDVINESFGGNPFPDNDNDPIALADQAAVHGGVTVVVSSGDAGYNGTMGTPSTDPLVISSGATTQLRLYRQAGYGAAFFATNGWLSNNLSAFSSGGFSMSGPRVPDTVAPGDLGWALCVPLAEKPLFTECDSPLGGEANPPAIQIFGGTSESSPLTAGEAALVIQAYRSTHHGRDPSPALVKEIIMSTSTDLGAPPTEQGAGLINSLAAVNAALAVRDQNGGAAPNGNSLLNNPTNVSITDLPRAPESATVAITNTGSAKQHLEPRLQVIGPPIAGATTTVTLAASDPIFPSPAGLPRNYVLQHFTVPEGADHLDAAIAWQVNPFTGPAVTVDLGLIDPSGKDAGYTIPQGASSAYGHFDVNHPAAGTWTAVIWTSAVSDSYYGPVVFSWTAERYVQFGSVSPASFELAPGATQWITARFSMPAQPGDQAVAIRFPGNAAHSEVPIALRTLVPTGPNGGFFNGTMTGGNGRGSTGPTQTFAFEVPRGVKNMSLSVQDSDSFWLLEGLLVAPDGMQLSVEPNFDANENPTVTMQLNRDHPTPGQWRFILLQNLFASGNETSLPFTAQINFDGAQVNATGLPQDPHTKLSVGAGAVSVPITITNTGGLAQAYFADARLEGALTTLTFGTFPICTAANQLPYGCFGTFLPTQVQSAQFIAQAGAPITMDVAGDTGYLVGVSGAPDLTARSVGPNTVVASISESEVPWGEWELLPTLIGPFGPAGAPPTPVTTSVAVELKPFDATVTSDHGDLWSDVTFGTSTYNPLVLGPGATGTIYVTITPSASQVGTTVHGTIYIDTFNAVVQTGDEVVGIPYSYTVVR